MIPSKRLAEKFITFWFGCKLYLLFDFNWNHGFYFWQWLIKPNFYYLNIWKPQLLQSASMQKIDKCTHFIRKSIIRSAGAVNSQVQAQCHSICQPLRYFILWHWNLKKKKTCSQLYFKMKIHTISEILTNHTDRYIYESNLHSHFLV